MPLDRAGTHPIHYWRIATQLWSPETERGHTPCAILPLCNSPLSLRGFLCPLREIPRTDILWMQRG